MCEELNRLLKERQLLFERNNQNWYLKKSRVSGFGVFTTKSYEAGELIFKDTPIVLGPRSSMLPPSCVCCLKMDVPLIGCSKGCRLPICSRECENSQHHMKECELLRKFLVKEEEFWSPLLYRALTPFRSLLTTDLDKKILQLLSANKKNEHVEMKFLKKELQIAFTEDEESFLNHCCAVLNGTAFETELGVGNIKTSVRGLYPLAGMMNHSCVPNTQRYFLFQNNIQTMLVEATCQIPEGTELTTSYTYLMWPTIVRRHYLSMTKEFWCTCPRCQDPTEFGSNLSALECSCGGLVLPKCAINMKSDWKCGSCNNVVPATKLPFAHPSILGDQRTLPAYKIKYLGIKDKLDKVWNMGHKKTTYQDVCWSNALVPLVGIQPHRLGLSDEELNYKDNITREMLDLNKVLMLGNSRLKGLLLLELYETLQEKNNRNLNISEEELYSIRDDAKKILHIPIE